MRVMILVSALVLTFSGTAMAKLFTGGNTVAGPGKARVVAAAVLNVLQEMFAP